MSGESTGKQSTSELRRTPLYGLHDAMDAKFTAFAGYSMPVEYSRGVKQEHLHVRRRAGLFDVSHMGQIAIRGEHIAEDLECLVPSNIVGLSPFQQRYTVLTNDHGGIVDDVMITRLPEGCLLVANAAFVSEDIAHLRQRLAQQHTIELLDSRSLLALQGPHAVACLAKWTPDIANLKFLHSGHFSIDRFECVVSRCGYTGCDGFEISLDQSDVVAFAELLLQDPDVALVGLGARDTLRLEAGLCLAGADFDAHTSPVEAALEWLIAKKYRSESGAIPQFPGAAKIMHQIASGTLKRRVGLKPQGRAPVRAGALLLHNDREVGYVTSGSYGPTFGGPVAMGYVPTEHAEPGKVLNVTLRGRRHEVEVISLPFVAHSYYRS